MTKNVIQFKPKEKEPRELTPLEIVQREFPNIDMFEVFCKVQVVGFYNLEHTRTATVFRLIKVSASDPGLFIILDPSNVLLRQTSKTGMILSTLYQTVEALTEVMTSIKSKVQHRTEDGSFPMLDIPDILANKHIETIYEALQEENPNTKVLIEHMRKLYEGKEDDKSTTE